MDILASMHALGHEQVLLSHDPSCGYFGIIAIHDTTLGPALGGTRFWQYASTDEAIAEVGARRRGELDADGERELGDLDAITVGEQLGTLARAAVVADRQPAEWDELDAVDRRADQRMAPADRGIGHDDIARRVATDHQALATDAARHPIGSHHMAPVPRAVHVAIIRDRSGLRGCSRGVVGSDAPAD
jgi:hypothetical protein